jgi:hypothetical protein
MTFNDFPEENFDSLGNGFITIAGFPFVATTPYSAGLTAFGTLIKLLSGFINRKFDNDKEFFTTAPLNVADYGPQHKSGYYVVTDSRTYELEKDFPDAYTLNDDFNLINKNTKQNYRGDTPYIIIGIDGTEDKSLNNFEPSLVTADLINKYYGKKESQKECLEQLLEGITYCTDLYYRNKVDSLDDEIKKLPQNASEKTKEKLLAERDAYAKNIINDLMKKKYET